MRKTIITILLLISQTLMFAQAEAHTKADRPSYAIGDYIRIELSVTGPSTAIFGFPDETTISNFDIIGSNPIDTQRADNKITLTKRIIYSIYEAGDVYFPQVSIPYRLPNDTTQYVVVADSIPLSVTAIEVDTTQAIKPIKTVLDVDIHSNKWLFWFKLINGLIAIGFIIWFFLIRKKEVHTPKQKAPKLSIYERTMMRLVALQEKQLWQKGDLKLYYSELTDILRDYLEQRYGMHAQESTSDEIVAQLERNPETQQDVSNITFVLHLSDMAKFAKSQPLPDENLRAYQLVSSFVEHTAEKPTEENKQI